MNVLLYASQIHATSDLHARVHGMNMSMAGPPMLRWGRFEAYTSYRRAAAAVHLQPSAHQVHGPHSTSASGVLQTHRHAGDAATLPIVKKILPAIRSEQGISKLAAIGYCWGGRYSLLAGGSILGAELEAANGQIDCFAACHPSWVTMPGDVEQVQKPGIFICAESDNIFPRKAVQQTKDITARLQKERNLPEGYWQLKQYPGTSHGFAIRGDESMPIVAEARKDVLKVTFDFFMQHL